MSGAITQLVALGAQDAFLVGDPQVSFFRTVFKRHSNYAANVHRQIIQSTPAQNGMSVVKFERKGDLLSYVYLARANGAAFTANHVDKVELYIGGQLIDTQDQVFSTNIYADQMTSGDEASKSLIAIGEMYPIHFFFCDTFSASLPLVALQFHDVEMRIYWSTSGAPDTNIECYANFISLDQEEREWFASNSQDMLITQVQKIPLSSKSTQELILNHPVKFIAGIGTGDPAVITSGGTPAATKLNIQYNGTDVGEPKSNTPHFNETPNYYHTAFGHSTNHFLIPYCLQTFKYQPTGSLNFSRLDSARIMATNGTSLFNVSDLYAVNYNILRIQDGMGGALFAN